MPHETDDFAGDDDSIGRDISSQSTATGGTDDDPAGTGETGGADDDDRDRDRSGVEAGGGADPIPDDPSDIPGIDRGTDPTDAPEPGDGMDGGAGDDDSDLSDPTGEASAAGSNVTAGEARRLLERAQAEGVGVANLEERDALAAQVENLTGFDARTAAARTGLPDEDVSIGFGAGGGVTARRTGGRKRTGQRDISRESIAELTSDAERGDRVALKGRRDLVADTEAGDNLGASSTRLAGSGIAGEVGEAGVSRFVSAERRAERRARQRANARVAVTRFGNQQLQANREQFGDIDFSAGLGDPNVDEVERFADETLPGAVEDALPDQPDSPTPSASRPTRAGPLVSPTVGLTGATAPGGAASRAARGIVTDVSRVPATALEAAEAVRFTGGPLLTSPTLAATTGRSGRDTAEAVERVEATEQAAGQAAEATVEDIRENPREALFAAGFGAVASVGSGVALSRGARLARSRVRTAGATDIDPEGLTGQDVIEANAPDGGGGQTFPPVRGSTDPADQADVLARQAEEFTPEEVRDVLGGDAPEDAADLKKALDVEPEGPDGGDGFEAPPSDTAEAAEFETPGTSVGPELSPFFFRESTGARFSPVPGLPDLGGSPTAAVIRTELRETDAGDVDEFSDELLEAEEAGDRAALTLPPDEFSPGEAELVIPPSATFEQVTDTGLLSRFGLGADLATETPGGQRVPVRVFRDPDLGDADGGLDADGLEGTTEINTDAETVEVTTADLRREARRAAEQPVERPTPPVSGTSGAGTEEAPDTDPPDLDGTRTRSRTDSGRPRRGGGRGDALDEPAPTTSDVSEGGSEPADVDVSNVGLSEGSDSDAGSDRFATLSSGGGRAAPSDAPSTGPGSSGGPPSSPPSRPPSRPPSSPPSSPPPETLPPDTDDQDEFRFSLGESTSKIFGGGVVGPDFIQTGSLSEFDEAEADTFVKAVDADTSAELRSTSGEPSAATGVQRQQLQEFGVDIDDA